MRPFLIAGNWKMNLTCESAVALATAVAEAAPAEDSNVQVLVAPPFPYLVPVATAISGSNVQLGAQNSYFEGPGAFTGETANEMLLDVGCSHVILGHSERRHVLGETDEIIGKKTAAALAKGLKVILCVGELLSEREANQTESVLDTQMAGGLADVSEADMANVVIAYEPVWAIGTGKTASPDQAESAHAHLRKWLASRYNSGVADGTCILYGGSVKPDNAAELLSQENVDGALVGGASLKADLFAPIINAAIELTKAN